MIICFLYLSQSEQKSSFWIFINIFSSILEDVLNNNSSAVDYFKPNAKFCKLQLLKKDIQF